MESSDAATYLKPGANEHRCDSVVLYFQCNDAYDVTTLLLWCNVQSAQFCRFIFIMHANVRSRYWKSFLLTNDTIPMQFFKYRHCTDRRLYISDSSISLSMYIVVLGTRSLSGAASALQNHNTEPAHCNKLKIAESQCHHCTIATMLYLSSARTLFRITNIVIRRERLFRKDRGTRNKDDPCQVLRYGKVRNFMIKLDIVGLRYNYPFIRTVCNTMNILSAFRILLALENSRVLLVS